MPGEGHYLHPDGKVFPPLCLEVLCKFHTVLPALDVSIPDQVPLLSAISIQLGFF